MPPVSEIFEIPGNAAISAAERLARTQALYVPFHHRAVRFHRHAKG